MYKKEFGDIGKIIKKYIKLTKVIIMMNLMIKIAKYIENLLIKIYNLICHNLYYN